MVWCLLSSYLAEANSPPGTVVAWGNDANGQATPPPGLSNVVAVAGGPEYSLALRSDGSMVEWGFMIAPPPALSNVISIAAGGDHSLALQSNGTVVAWGSNLNGETNVPPGLGNVMAIAAGYYHSLALQTNGTVVAWGWNGYGQTTPPPGLSNVVAVAAGQYHSLALQSNGTVVAWGAGETNNPSDYRDYGQAIVPPGLSNVVAIAAGWFHSLALRADSTVVAWGEGSCGECNIPPGLSNVVAIAAGDNYSLALLASGRVVDWGSVTTPPPGLSNMITPPSALSNVVAIAAGDEHCLAIALPPVILSQPSPIISLSLGTLANLTVAVAPGIPFGCQWWFDGLPLAGAIGTNLLITNFDLTEAGAYSVMVTNPYFSANASCVLRITNSPVVLVNGIDVGGGLVNSTNTAQVAMDSSFGPNANIYYTLDGSAPSWLSTLYRGSFQVAVTASIRAIAYDQAYLSSAEAAPINLQIMPSDHLTAVVPGGGSLSFRLQSVHPTNIFIGGTLVTAIATPFSGWSFVGWLGDATGSNPATLLVTGQAVVQPIFGSPVVSNVLGPGQIQFTPQESIYPFGTVIGLAAIPQTGNYLMSWAGALSGSINPNSLVVTSPSPVVTALFGPLAAGQYALTVVPQGGGTVTMSPYTNRYNSGQVVSVTAVPTPGQTFLGWSGDVTGSQNPLNVTISQSKTIIAIFTKCPSLRVGTPLEGLVESGFRLTLLGEFGAAYSILSSPNLSDWAQVGIVTNAYGIVQFTDPAATNVPARFYRALRFGQ